MSFSLSSQDKCSNSEHLGDPPLNFLQFINNFFYWRAKSECAVLDMVYQVQSKGHNPSLICLLQSDWCRLVCHCPSLCRSVPQDWQLLFSSTTVHQSSPNTGPCIHLLNFMRLLSAHFSSKEEFSVWQKIYL